jgi:hypothetical protein
VHSIEFELAKTKQKIKNDVWGEEANEAVFRISGVLIQSKLVI